MAAPLGNEYAKANLKYDEKYNIQAYKLCLLGATDKTLSDFFEVSEATINNWKKEFPKFFESINEGKKIADMEVASSLYDGTQDRAVTEMKAVKVKEVYWEGGKRCEKETVELHPETRVIAADFRNIQFWLKNRNPEKWRDSTDITTNGKELPASTLNITLPDGKNIDDFTID